MQNIIFIIVFLGSCYGDSFYTEYKFIWGYERELSYTFSIINQRVSVRAITDGPKEPEIRGECGKVQAFYIYGTTKTIIPKKYVNAFINLKSMRVEKTDLKSIKKITMHGLHKLKNLYLGRNQIATIDRNSFDHLVHLEHLYLNGNQLKQLDNAVFSGLFKLKMIMLDDNQLTSLSPELFSNNRHLERAYLTNNKIAIIEPSVFDHLSIRSFDLRRNDCINLSTSFDKKVDLIYVAKKCCKGHPIAKECKSSNLNEIYYPSDPQCHIQASCNEMGNYATIRNASKSIDECKRRPTFNQTYNPH